MAIFWGFKVQILQVGMTMVVDHSGRLFTRRKPTIKDVITNAEAGDDENVYI